MVSYRLALLELPPSAGSERFDR